MAMLAQRKIVYHDFYEEAKQVCGVVLLNSPACGPWECEEYVRLLRTRRYSQETQHSRCYFVCADGAHHRIRSYVDERQATSPDLRLLSKLPLCDAAIGDMDSYGPVTDWDGTELYATAPADGYATVEDIPADLLDAVHAKYNSSIDTFMSLTEGSATQRELLDSEGSQSSGHVQPFRIFVRCQMTNDFQKAVKFLHLLRSRFPEELARVPSHLLCSPSGISLLQTGGTIFKDVGDIGSDIDDQRESGLCAEACCAEAAALPTYVALGALGGRFDHEMGSISVILENVKLAHVVISDETNTIFACHPNGWTQFVRHSKHEGVKCGLINFGIMKECETSGLLYNVVIGKEIMSETKDLVLGFGRLLSACNSIRREVVTIDLRCPVTFKRSQSSGRVIRDQEDWTDDGNPPTLFTVERNRKANDERN